MDPAAAVLADAIALREPINQAIKNGNSDIQRWYNDSVVFVTGATGFLGKHLIEKLLRSCNIKRIYVLTRPKKDLTVTERWEQILKDPVFEYLRDEKPTFADRIYPIEGDISELRHAISNDDWHTITEEVNVIFHVAATTRFDEPLKKAALMNVRGTLETVKLGKECKRLRSFVHLSTAFAHATKNLINKEVFEEFYPAPILPETLMDMVDKMDEKDLLEMTEQLIKGWPNTYTFTKAVAEEVIRANGSNFPVNIVRPPLVVASYCEPTPGWLEAGSIYGPSGIILGVGLGITHVVLNKKNAMLAYMPVDYVTNATIAAGWDAATRTDRLPTIFAISNIKCGFHWGKSSALLKSEEFRKLSTPKAIWRCFVYETPNLFMYWILTWLLHYIPAYIVDTVCTLFNIKMPKGMPSLLKIYTKLYKSSTFLAYFLRNEFYFQDGNTENLISKLSSQDRLIFNFDVKTIDWPQMFKIWCMGLRKYIIKDGLENSPLAYKKQQRFKYVNYILLSLYCFVLFKIIVIVIYFIMNVLHFD